MKHLFVIDRHYWPDTNPLSVMLPKIIDWLKEEGCRVTVLTAQPGYKPDLEISRQPFVERRDNLTVIRLSLLPSNWGHGIRYLNYFLFLFAALFIVPVLSIRARKQRRYCMTATMPPVIQPFLFSILSRMTFMKFIYNIQDIHPEIMIPLAGLKTEVDNQEQIVKEGAAKVFDARDDIEIVPTYSARSGTGGPVAADLVLVSLEDVPLALVLEASEEAKLHQRRRLGSAVAPTRDDQRHEQSHHDHLFQAVGEDPHRV